MLAAKLSGVKVNVAAFEKDQSERPLQDEC